MFHRGFPPFKNDFSPEGPAPRILDPGMKEIKPQNFPQVAPRSRQGGGAPARVRRGNSRTVSCAGATPPLPSKTSGRSSATSAGQRPQKPRARRQGGGGGRRNIQIIICSFPKFTNPTRHLPFTFPFNIEYIMFRRPVRRLWMARLPIA